MSRHYNGRLSGMLVNQVNVVVSMRECECVGVHSALRLKKTAMLHAKQRVGRKRSRKGVDDSLKGGERYHVHRYRPMTDYKLPGQR